MNEASWPIFIAAPFIPPSVSTSLLGRVERQLVHALVATSPCERTRLAALAPAKRAPSTPAACRPGPSGPAGCGGCCGPVSRRPSVQVDQPTAVRQRSSAASRRLSTLPPDGQRTENLTHGRAARGARLARQPAAAARRASCPASSTASAASRCRSRSTRAGCAPCSPRATRCSTSSSTAATASP